MFIVKIKSRQCRIGLYIILFLLIRHSKSSEDKGDIGDYSDEYAEEDYYDEDPSLGHTVEIDSNNSSTNLYLGISSTTVTPTSTTTASSKLAPDTENNVAEFNIEQPNIEETLCPNECECSDGNQEIDCSQRNLTQVPNLLPKTAIRIDLSDNQIEELSSDVFQNTTNLRHLILSKNQITILPNEIFSNLKKLQHVNLADNQLTNIPAEILSNSTELEILQLSDNPIILPEAEPFLVQPKLKELHLRNCSLEIIYLQTFSQLNQLVSLNLLDNPVEKINTEILELMKNLQTLKLPEISEKSITELCNVLPSIDIISFKNYGVSCFEIVAGYGFEESKVTTYTPTVKQRENKDIGEEQTNTKSVEGRKPDRKAGFNRDNMNSTSLPKFETNATAIHEGQIDDGDGEATVDDDATYQIAVSQQTLNYALIGIMIAAVIGIVIGIMCRLDVCGIKTKLCRTRRPAPTDQVRPAEEEIPLNKV